MSLVIGEIIQARIQGTVVDQQFSVSQFYRITQNLPLFEGNGVAFDVWELFKVQWRAVQGLQAAYRTLRVEVVSLTNPLGLGGTYDIPPAEQAGVAPRTGEVMPPYVAFGIQLRGISRLVRPGSRRLPWVYETDQNGGTIVPATLVEYGALAEQFGETLVSNDIIVGGYGTPVLVGRNADGSFDLTRTLDIVSTSAKPLLTSQVSRKQGRGS